jgi:CXXX repeat modification system protein
MANNEIKMNNTAKKEIGTVAPDERDEIRELFERKNGLVELAKSLAGLSKEELDGSPLFDKITRDMGQVNIRFQDWWDRMSQKYKWENQQGFKWEISFDTCKIFLMKQ